MTESGKCAFVIGIELLDNTDGSVTMLVRKPANIVTLSSVLSKNGSVTMCQRRYVNDILKRFNMKERKVVASPVDVSSRLTSSNVATKISVPFRS